MNNHDIQKTAEMNFFDLCIAATRVSFGKVEITQSYSYTKNCIMDFYDKVYLTNARLFDGANSIDIIKEKIMHGEFPNSLYISSKLVTMGIDQLFLENGFTVFYEQTPMAVRRSTYTEKLSCGEDIRQIKSKKELEPWIDCVERAFGRKRDITLYSKLSERKDISLWGLYKNDSPVSTVLILTSGKTSGLHLIGTNPQYRGNGYGSEITTFAIQKAFREHYNIVVLLSSNKGKTMYSSLGFMEYGKVVHLKMIEEPSGIKTVP